VVVLAALVGLLGVAPGRSAAEEPKPEAKLVGTWKLVSAKYGGKEVKAAEGVTQIKHVTPGQFVWFSYDKEGKIDTGRMLGGSYTVNGNKYEETPEYGAGPILPAFKGKKQSFEWKIEGNKWYHAGKLSGGLEIEEVWERVEKK